MLSLARSIKDGSSQAETLAALASRLAELPQTDLYTIWCELLTLLSHHTRADLLSDLELLSKLLAHLGKTAAISETAQAVQDVGRWWP